MPESIPGLDPLYVAARRVLLDALAALADHRSAVILAGAQAIYLHAGEADLAGVAPYTTDADLMLHPRNLGPRPAINEVMQAAGFQQSAEPGIWTVDQQVDGRKELISVDLLVPEVMAGAGRRAARIPKHGRHVARRIPGLEAALADNSERTIASLEPHADKREVRVLVAGVGALLIAKAHKLNDRAADAERGTRQDRLKPKDAGDVVRLMRTGGPEEIGARLRSLATDPELGPSVRNGVSHLRRLFGHPRAAGANLAVVALAGALPEATVRGLVVAYVERLANVYDAG